jgi:hypothetical protein
VFLVGICAYALLIAGAALLLRERLDEAIVSLLLLAMIPCVTVAWALDGLRTGVLLRLGSRSTSMAVWKVTRQEQPGRFWLAIGVAFLLAVGMLAFVAVGIWLRLTLAG